MRHGTREWLPERPIESTLKASTAFLFEAPYGGMIKTNLTRRSSEIFSLTAW